MTARFTALKFTSSVEGDAEMADAFRRYLARHFALPPEELDGTTTHNIDSSQGAEAQRTTSTRTIDVSVIVEALRPSLVDELVGRLAEVATSHRLEGARHPQDSMAKATLAEKATRLEATITAILLAVSDQPLEAF